MIFRHAISTRGHHKCHSLPGLPCTARVMLGAGDNLLKDAGAMFGRRYVRHAGGDLAGEAMVQILQPWIDGDVVLEPRNKEQHVG